MWWYRCFSLLLDLAEFEGGESKMTTLISAAADLENISRKAVLHGYEYD